MILDEILVVADRRAADARSSLGDLQARARSAGPVRNLEDALGGDGLSVLAEIKRRSPSAGSLAADLDPVAQALAYEAGGCAAISVLTEPEFFDGSLDDLAAVRSTVGVPVLRKDFTRDPAQIVEARASGADAVLLILAALDDATLAACLATATDLGVDAIVEVHTEAEARRAVDAEARIVGVNNRDLTTFRTDLAVAESIAPIISDAPVRIAESGVSTPEGAARMAVAGYGAILVGEALVRSPDPADLVRRLRGAT